MTDSVRLSRDGAVAEILIDRPGRMNALRVEDFVAFTRLAEEIATSDARAVLVHGAGGAFCAGWDIAEADPVGLDAEALIRRSINPLFRAIRAIPVPTIAAVEGACLGGGFGIAFACDIVLAAEDARIGSPFRNLGVVPDSGTHHVLRERLGHHVASEMIYLGRSIAGSEAAARGLVNAAYPTADLLPAARAMAVQISTGPTAAFRCSKRILLEGVGYDAMLDDEAVAQGEVIATADGIEGFRAFQSKRRPDFVGR